ncbi:hypothetical protein CEP52_010804 [Fusarium oligoseptatum]|uniref:Dehydrogenase n=1 Tax=Fusarium oligoseptatum TaxID=2604345 RepID=A0A428T6B9_9HYPO|nr:hypothetical protein CEP52_010804 [Fusarium oligoseptatum]
MASLIPRALKTRWIVAGTALNPTLLASALAFVTYGLPHLIVKVTGSDIIARWVSLFGLKTALKVLVVLAIGYALNRIRNIRASNNWSLFGRGKWIWQEEIAVITGGCNGIGKAIVLALVRKGVRVAILDVADLPPDLAQIDIVFHWKCDISSPSAVASAADSIRETIGDPSILINNASMANRSSILDLAPEKASKLFGHQKAGALAFHEGLACEIKHLHKAPGVLTTVAHPMWVDTNMTKDRQEAIERGGGNKMMKPEDVAQVVADQIFSRRGAQLIIPPKVTWLSGVKGFPNWLQESIRDSIAKTL